MNITIPRRILEGIFDECDKYQTEETGGRLLGFYRGHGNNLKIDVRALIGPGPNAKRTQVSFFQDGDYQERIFRAVERQHPRIEHLGNWHTHHVNGLETLSNGDTETYGRNVNSEHHNTDFFYALLVTRKLQMENMRYAIRHFVFFRGFEGIVEPTPNHIHITHSPVLSLRSVQ